jgi:hypothetical protein
VKRPKSTDAKELKDATKFNVTIGVEALFLHEAIPDGEESRLFNI